MWIERIEIKNYRSCIDTTFTPHKNLSALIGPNGSGKTNILSAIKLLSALCSSRSRLKNEEPANKACELKTWINVDGKTITHKAIISLVTNERNQDEIISAQEEWNLYQLTGSRKKVKIPSWIVMETFNPRTISHARIAPNEIFNFLYSKGIDAKTHHALIQVIRFFSKLNYYSASQFTNPGHCPISFEVEADSSSRRTGISITGHKKLLYDMYEGHRSQSKFYKEFLNIVGPNGIDLVQDIEFKEVVTSTSNYNVMTGGTVVVKEIQNLLIVPSIKISGNTLSPSQLSEGTFKTLALIFYLVTDRSSLLLLEEPEVCVHHGLLNSIIELIDIFSGEKQIIISTHSDSVLDKIRIDNLFRVTKESSIGTSISKIKKSFNVDELKALKEYLEKEGSLGEFWKHGGLENV